MIYARAILPDPDHHDGPAIVIERVFVHEDDFDRWADCAPEAVAATIVISDDKPLPPEAAGGLST